MSRYVKVTAKELTALLNDSRELRILEAGGVDNWDWYGESFEQYENEYPEDIKYNEAVVLEQYKEVL